MAPLLLADLPLGEESDEENDRDNVVMNKDDYGDDDSDDHHDDDNVNSAANHYSRQSLVPEGIYSCCLANEL